MGTVSRPEFAGSLSSFPRLNLGRFVEIILPAGLLAVGASLRLSKYFFNRSLWLDEAATALNIVDRSYIGLFLPLDYSQVAPPGFLVLVKAIVDAFGRSEYALRAVPMVGGLISMILIYVLARRSASKFVSILSLGLFALLAPLVEYSSEVKPYSTDTTVTLVILLMASGWSLKERSQVKVALYGLGGALALWISYPSVFVLASVALARLVTSVSGKTFRHAVSHVLAYSLWGLSFLVLYLVSSESIQNPRLNAYWSAGFLPSPTLSLTYIERLQDSYSHLTGSVMGLPLSSGVPLLVLVGFIALLARNVATSLRYGLPILLVLAASILELYPFRGRLLLFLVPALILATSEGVWLIVRSARHARWIMGVTVISVVLFHPLQTAVLTFGRPVPREEVRPIMGHLREFHQEGDAVYVYYSTALAFRYYQPEFGLDEIEYAVGISARANPELYLDNLDELLGHTRVWIMFSHIYRGGGVGNEEKYIVAHLDSIGELKDRFSRQGASLYLYDLGHSAKDEGSS